jgi:hypothetical protein
MEPVSVIVQALVAGAATGLQPTVSKVITDAYGALKSLVSEKFDVSVSSLERKPTDKARQDIVKEDITASDAAEDVEVLELSQRLLQALHTHHPEVEGIVGVNLKDLVTQASVAIRRVTSSGGGVSLSHAQIGGELVIEDINSGAVEKKSTEKSG